MSYRRTPDIHTCCQEEILQPVLTQSGFELRLSACEMNALTICAITVATEEECLFEEVKDFHNNTIMVTPQHKTLCPEGRDTSSVDKVIARTN